MTEIITMSKKELNRIPVLQDLADKRIRGSAAAKLLKLSDRQIRRLKLRFKQFGAKGLIHKSRGERSHHCLPETLTARAINLLKKHYSDFWPTHAQEKLADNHGLKLSKETVRQLMIAAKLWRPKKERLKAHYRGWRERKEQYGEMQQYDGSPHDWFEGRLPKCTLLAAIDDATSQITHARFAFDEGVKNTFIFWREYLAAHGKPLNIYLDRYSTYKINAKEQIDDPERLTQFQRAMEKDLNISVIHALSPEAKGRIERLFSTLQNRLPKELRLVKINSLDGANRFLKETFLPRFNQRFAVVAKKPSNLHRPVRPEELHRLSCIFSVQTPRTVNNDFTISFRGLWYQLRAEQPLLVLKKDTIVMEEHLDGSVWIRKGKHYLSFSRLPVRPAKTKDIPVTGLTSKKQFSWKPPMDHPWRKSLWPRPVEALAQNEAKTLKADILTLPKTRTF